MDKMEAYREYSLLCGNINKMLLADDADELLKLNHLAKDPPGTGVLHQLSHSRILLI